MSQRGYPHRKQVAYIGKEGLHFIELDEIKDRMELRSTQPKKDEQESKHEKLRIELHQAITRNRQERELHDQLLEQEKEIEYVIKEETAEKNILLNRVQELKQEVERLKKKRLVKEEEEDKPDPDLKKSVMCQTLYLKQSREEFNELQKQQRKLTIQHDQLVTERKKTQDSLSTYTAAEVTLKVELEQIRQAIFAKDKEIQKMSTDLKAAMNKIRQNDISEELTLDWKITFGIEKIHGHVMAVLQLCKNIQIFPKSICLPQGPVTEKCQEKKNSTTRSAQHIWKVMGALTLCGLCVLLVMANVAPLCSPDYDLWTILFEAVESYSELHLAFPSFN